jgi:catechol 2,3-dioxygenase
MDAPTTSIPNIKVGHVHLKVRDLEMAKSFYVGLLGFKVTEELARSFAFLSTGVAHHDIALQALGPSAPLPAAHATGLYHVAFEVPDEQEFRKLVSNIKKQGHEVTLVDHGISWAAYLSDPDENGVEIYVDRRAALGGKNTWEGHSARLQL